MVSVRIFSPDLDRTIALRLLSLELICSYDLQNWLSLSISVTRY